MIRRVLVAGSSASLRSAIRAALEKYFAAVVIEASTGLEGVVKAKQHQPDIIVLDSYMPGLSGEQALYRIRLEAGLSKCLVIVVNGENSRQAVEKFAQLGIEGYLIQPFHLKALLERFAKIIENDSPRNLKAFPGFIAD